MGALLLPFGTVMAQNCINPGPGKDGSPSSTLTGIVNTYFPGTATAASGATTITLGTSTGAATAIAINDLLLVIQMQDAAIDSTNTSSYGDGVAGAPASGSNGLNNSGKYEYVRATTAVPTTGGTVTIKRTSGGAGLLNTYTNAAATGTQGQRRFQVVRVPQYVSVALSSGLTALAWNGTTGGILAIDVQNVLQLNSATVSVSGLGFRAGGGRGLAGANGLSNTDYRTPAATAANGSKGEGIAGTPRFVFNSAATVVDTGVDGYPNGSSARGAPGNAGGGGTDGNPTVNDQNSGGGGGGNCGAGGIGGNTWSSQNATGGYGGAAFTASPGAVVMGGGGGAGARNNSSGNASSGGCGGGIVLIRAGFIKGAGTINANGGTGVTPDNDGGGGGGAGGSVVITCTNGGLAGLTINANGGVGTNAWPTQAPGGTPGERHGPGGGGGGGVVLVAGTGSPTISRTGGANGTTTTVADAYGATPGTACAATTTFTITSIPGVSSGAECLTPTESHISSFAARRYHGRVLLQWRTSYEINNLGFNLYRESNGHRVKLTPSLIAGTALMAGPEVSLSAGQTYSWWDDLAGASNATKYWLEDIDLRGSRTWKAVSETVESDQKPLVSRNVPLLSRLGAGAGHQTGWAELMPSEIESVSESPVCSGLSPGAREARQLGKGGHSPGTLDQKILAAMPAIKLKVRKEGWYRVKQPDLVAAGLNRTVNPRFLQLFVHGVQNPIIVSGQADGQFDPQDSLEFYGVGLDTPSTDAQVYWLVVGTKPGLRIGQQAAKPDNSEAAGSFPFTIERKDRTVYFAALHNGDAENFFGAAITDSPTQQTLSVQHVDQSSLLPARLSVQLQGVTIDPELAPNHHVKVEFNGSYLGDAVFDAQDGYTFAAALPHSQITEGPNTVTLTGGGTSDVSVVASIRLTYNHLLVADNNSLFFAAQGGRQVRATGFTQPPRVMDITDSTAIKEIVGTVEKSATDGYAVTFTAPGSSGRNFLAFSDEQLSAVAEIQANQPSTWSRSENAADLVIISHRDFINSLDSLRRLRESQGHSVAVVDVEDLYDEFNYGVKSPQAINDFLKLASSSWKTPARFTLLVGDASFDPRNYLGFGDFDFVPTRLVDTAYLETASDDWFGDFTNSGLSDLAIGRISVRTAAEAKAVVSKIVGYDQPQPVAPSWLQEVLLVADKNDAYDFEAATEQVRQLVQPGLTVSTVLLGQTDEATARTAILNGINSGKLIVNYVGHGSVESWSGQALLNSGDAAALTNAGRLPVFLDMTCLNGFFHDLYTESLAEALLKSPSGGAVAVWASSGLSDPPEQFVINQETIKQLSGGTLTLGEAVQRAKRSISNNDVRRTWILFGDPSMRLANGARR